MGGAYCLIAGNRYEYIGEWWCVNEIRVGSEEWQEKKWGNRPTLSEALPMYYDVWRMQAKLNMELRVKPILAKKVEDMKKASAMKKLRATILPTILAKKVEDMKKASAMSKLRKSVLPKKVQAMILAKRVKDIEQATIVQDVPPIQATSKTSIIAPKALPKPTWKIFDEPPKQVVATSKGDHQLVTSKGGQVYRGKPGRLKGCAGILQDVQPAGPLGIGDVLAIGVMGVG